MEGTLHRSWSAVVHNMTFWMTCRAIKPSRNFVFSAPMNRIDNKLKDGLLNGFAPVMQLSHDGFGTHFPNIHFSMYYILCQIAIYIFEPLQSTEKFVYCHGLSK